MVHLVATFLTNRSMTVKLGETRSSPREVWGGCPQGSILGVFLFNCTIDDLEDGCEDLTPSQDGAAGLGRLDDEDEEDEPEPGSSGGFSTPAKEGCPGPECTDSPVFPPGKRIEKTSRRLNMTIETRQEIPPEPNARTEAKWISTLGTLLRFIDDGFALTKVNFENSYGMMVNGVFYRVKHALQSQNIFRHLVRRAEEIGMVVNSSKTAMVCISDASAYEADAFILDEDQERIGCKQNFKALGLHFSSRPDMWEQVKAIQKNMRKRLWMLRNLKKSGFSQDELVKVYKTMIRPVADYGAVVYHSSLNDHQDELLENLQTAALKCVFGPGLSGRKMRSQAGIQTLRERREEMCLKFARKCAGNPLFAPWFPLKTTRSSARTGKTTEIYQEFTARCERLKNSPFFYFRRILNGKVGKTYGLRYEEYRR